ncbi:hypothetical protein ACN28I_38170 [Archangium gephyra]|uniref:hypothetical protein n=1 Tax=Archangium gephyra TaxID=48 RepID=UPI003B7F994D
MKPRNKVPGPVSRPPWGEIHPLPWSLRATKVWQHLYNSMERWDGLVGTDIQTLVREAEGQGCPPPPETSGPGRPRPQLPQGVPAACTELLRRHHDTWYGPAYMRELAHPESREGIQKKKELRRLMFCTPRGVLVSVGMDPPVSVVTAFRPDLPADLSGGDGSEPRDEDYYQEARSRWSRLVNTLVNTMSEQDAWKAEVLREIEEPRGQPPSRTREAWAWIRAIGHARGLVAREPEVALPLQAAEQSLARHRPDAVRLLKGRLRVEPLLAHLESSLAGAQSEETQDALLALEDLLVVAEVLGFDEQLGHLLGELSRLTRWWRSSLAGFESWARDRQEVSGPAARRFWDTVITAATAPPLPGFLQAWRESLESWTARVHHALEGLAITGALEPEAVLGKGVPGFFVVAEGHCPAGWGLRLFIIDAENPAGALLHEGTDYVRHGNGWRLEQMVWRLQGEDATALVMAIAAPMLPETVELERLLEETASSTETRLATVLLTPSTGRTP